MDCRRSVVVALALLSGLLGCSLRSDPPTLVGEQPADVRPEADLPKRPPKAATCVQFGQFAEKEAQGASRTPADREQLLDRARKSYQQALEIDKKNLPAAQALGRLYASLGDHERAVAAYQKALKHHPREVALWSELGMCHARQKEWDPALKCFRKGLDLDPENRPAAHQLGYCLARAGRYEESLACFKKTDGDAKAHYNLARMLHHMNQEDLSRQHVVTALEMDPHLRPAQQLLSQLNAGALQARPVVPVVHETAPEAPPVPESSPPPPSQMAPAAPAVSPPPPRLQAPAAPDIKPPPPPRPSPSPRYGSRIMD